MLWQYRFLSKVLVLSGFLLVPATLSFAQDAPGQEMTPRERTLMAQSYSTEKLCAWQKRLNLSDWKISVMVVRTSDLKPKTLGNIHWDGTKKTAVIRVLDPADYKLPPQAMLDDMEFTVVHELIHLELSPVLTPLQRNDANRMEEEHAVNHMAQALLDLERAK
ncbi:MAG: hypothetical protein WBY44_31000 [Bryobacteraceae bacterium]|jgi:hypothetical protein